MNIKIWAWLILTCVIIGSLAYINKKEKTINNGNKTIKNKKFKK